MENINKKNLELLEYIKKTDKLGLPRLQAFANFANKYNLKCETVRNLYYNLAKANDLQKAFNIEQSTHFTREELDDVMSKVVQELNRSKSVRAACYIVSGGDAKQMLRIQNKFRSLLKNNRAYLIDLGLRFENKKLPLMLKKSNLEQDFNMHKIASKLSTNGNNTIYFNNLNAQNDKIDTISKVLKMPKNNALTDADINNLFMGLVRMVKRNALENAPTALKNECDLANASLKDALLKLGASTRKLEIIKCENYELKKQLEDSERLLHNARSEVEELLNKIDNAGKIEELKNFIQSYKKKNNEDFKIKN